MNTAACNSAVSTVLQTELQELSSEACIKRIVFSSLKFQYERKLCFINNIFYITHCMLEYSLSYLTILYRLQSIFFSE